MEAKPQHPDVSASGAGSRLSMAAERISPRRRTMATATTLARPPFPPFTRESARVYGYVATILFGILLSASLVAGITPFPANFHTQMVPTNGTSLYVRVGGKGPAVVLLHGFGFTGDMWAPLAIVLAKEHTVIVPDLRGMGMSDHPDTGYTKKNQAVDIAGVMDALKVQKADLVTHDIGNMVGYA